jgi:phosphoadenylyl-sulfate reductase (thioredoxin)
LSIEIAQLETLAAPELLQWAMERYRSRFAITTSFQGEGMVVLDIAARISPDVRVITLDTGRLPEETYEIIETVRARYGVRVEVISPDPSEIEAMVTRYGPNLFYESVPFRNLCCHFRKVRPLERKLIEFDAWAVGLRRTQSETRESLAKVSTIDGRLKLSPLADWSAADVEEYTREFDVPRHPLYARGYTSIGCAPCTRATRAGETERAGRWWWEQDGHKECGIHFTPDGRVQRTLDVLVQEILAVPHA